MTDPNGGAYTQHSPNGVHVVGSVPLPSASAVFSKLVNALPGRLRRIPDGEPAERQDFVIFQRESFSAVPHILRQYDASFNPVPSKLPTNSEIADVLTTINKSGPIQTNYDTHAIASYKDFKSLQAAGQIPADVKFQVSLPTPINFLCLIADGYQGPIEPLYEEALLRALQNIEDSIPHSALAIQWDIASEFAMLEGATWPHFNPFFSPVREGIIERSLRLINAVSADVDVGLHLCYGDIGHRHFFEPKDMAHLVDIAKTLKTQAKRDINFIHMPVPKDRTDSEYFAPLKELELGTTELYLGVVHYNDLEGTKRRITAAHTAVEKFGVATECGMGRTPADQLDSILEVSAAVSAPQQP
ncbi:hypothetical protein H2198_009454 [Neophaeococcomyces mojaviensis]|uniref:Uncharacterized protein n=1 Tax=Neophaeococcomyces mojaviensis TaxID=3383035 RepID=A0ACC2ZUN5_9EURO|nr:hypothetical protein H2198_009454 [Knufia sp. JES_112]